MTVDEVLEAEMPEGNYKLFLEDMKAWYSEEWLKSPERESYCAAFEALLKLAKGEYVLLADVMKIVEIVEDHYPAIVFPEPTGEKVGSVDRYTASGCRLACRIIRKEIKSLLSSAEKG